ncbi:hypothetical protein DF16_orf03341 [Bacillus thuringiensis serovar kurstaki str. YBT-1520]|nr:hypothetical protein HD73_2900 [Bacillus thuringiensis serovar kurstaki str. HD73]AIM31756.1 hypothetical protein DF16_orf03341 [Bacillus thuringiensis serovar kurstaki str. YBT-1520]EEL55600.1 hypothetical protein bcere0023_28940 [Bacillus cereus Rock4-2]EEL64492.1 hypothetical protein bcere0025_27260 [Bacillus cereus F65185]KEH47019.1 hypothetical protein BG09_4257 [Bacillus thuringiensis serovar kurstaki str. HD-1]KLA08466.1 hypothetical protein B4158_3002 [Bacillus cereus]
MYLYIRSFPFIFHMSYLAYFQVSTSLNINFSYHLIQKVF